MKKQELINEVVTDTGVTKEQAAQAVNIVFNAIKETLKHGDKVRLTGFGTLGVKDNSEIKKKMVITARKLPLIEAENKIKEAG